MALTEIKASATRPNVKMVVGSRARLVLNADGTVRSRIAAGTRPTMTICPAVCKLVVGTEPEVAAEAARIVAARPVSK